MIIAPFSPTIRRREMDAVLSCMVSEKIGPGELNARLIKQVKEFFVCEGALALRSPSLALKYALKALDLPLESGIMISALAPLWHVQTVLDLGYKPVILDVSEESSLVTPEQVEAGIKKGGRLLFLHETMGLVTDFSVFSQFDIPIIEDISQSAGASYAQKKAGMFGVFSILGLEEQDILTAGGGAVLIAPNKREAVVLKKYAEQAPITDILPDINSALAFIQLKELPRNEHITQEIYAAYMRSLMQSGHKTLTVKDEQALQALYTFPVVLESGFKQISEFALRKDIKIVQAFEKTIIAHFYDDTDCIHAKSLLLRCAQFPLYARLGKSQVEKVVKVLASLP